jgi:hypothetical protein
LDYFSETPLRRSRFEFGDGDERAGLKIEFWNRNMVQIVEQAI